MPGYCHNTQSSPHTASHKLLILILCDEKKVQLRSHKLFHGRHDYSAEGPDEHTAWVVSTVHKER